MSQRGNAEGSTTWTYDACYKGAGRLCEVKVERSATDYFTRRFGYDLYGRQAANRLTVNGGPSFASALNYDPFSGRLAGRTYPTGLRVSYAYTPLGYLEKLILGTPATVTPLPNTPGGTTGVSANLATGTVLWQGQVMNAWGEFEQQGYLNGQISRAQFDPFTGRTASLTAGVGTATNVLNHAYTWDSLNNLTARADNNGDGASGAVTESFEYGDLLNRLTKYTVAGASISGGSRAVTLQYNALGMLLSKSDVGNYVYGSSGTGNVRPHALQSLSAGSTSTSYGYDANGNLISASSGKYRSIAYNSFNLPDSQVGIAGASGGASGGTARYTWAYDEKQARVKEVRTLSGGSMAGTRTTWSLHPDNAGGLGYEMEVNSPAVASAANLAVTSHRHYLEADGRTIGVLVSTGNLPALTDAQSTPPTLANAALVKVEYWYQDHLGSTAATTDHTGNVTARYAYDPFGKRRYPNGSYDAGDSLIGDWSPATNHGTDRGFTGHDHLDDLALVHMNGRVFNPGLGLFLQADPLIRSQENLQNFNRYSYCLNNPLTCIDPTGFADESDGWAGCNACLQSDGKYRLETQYISGSRESVNISTPQINQAPFTFSRYSVSDARFQVASKGFSGTADENSSWSRERAIRLNNRNWDRAHAARDIPGMQEAYDRSNDLSGDDPASAMKRIGWGNVLTRARIDAGSGPDKKTLATMAQAGFSMGMSGNGPGSGAGPKGVQPTNSGAAKPRINVQQQAGHVPGTPQYKNRIKQGKATSAFHGGKSGEMATRIAFDKGALVPGRPNVKEYDFGVGIGTGPNGGVQTRVRVHQRPNGDIHGHPSGPESF